MTRCAYILLILMSAAFIGCKPRVPKEYIQPRQLEDILYDYHVADGMAYAEGNYSELAFRRQAYREAALRKHGVTEAQLDSSLVYYYRHAERLHEIYEKLAKRLNDDAVALGATANELSQFGNVASQGDTATVWRNDRSVVLMPQAPYHVVSFDVAADSAYHEGDKMILSFDNQFIFQEGIRDGVAMLAVTFKNDSTYSQVMHIVSDNHYNIQIPDGSRKGIKHVRGFIYLGKGNQTLPSGTQTLKLMCISNMRLLRMHTEPPKAVDEADADTIVRPDRPERKRDDLPVTMHPEVRVGDNDTPEPHADRQPPVSPPPPPGRPHI